MTRSIYEKYGGFAQVSKVVMSFYDRVLESDQLAGYFEDVDMRRLIDHQTKFISTLMGGPASFTDQRIQSVHAHLGIDQASFNEVTMLLRETLEDFDFDELDIETVMKEVQSKQSLIVTK